MSNDTVSPDQDAIDPTDYVILEPGRLIVTYLRDGDCDTHPGSRLLSVVRFLNAEVDPRQLEALAELTRGLESFFHAIDGGVEVALYKVAN